ncbi:MAG: zinc ribbon domain-containing protein [Acidobacteria bacterium]|jgi:ribosomal protein L40E|nr:zinc ribbon domain-containing protein [Acidobacteriota bacterium]
MTQASIENKVCSACGAEARTNALFCHKCGGSLNVKDDKAAIERSAPVENNASITVGKNGLNELNDISLARNDGDSGTEIKVFKAKKQVVAELGTEIKVAKVKNQAVVEEISAPETVFVNEIPNAPEIEKKSSIREEAKLKTAGSLRVKSKTLQPKIIEEVWQEHENAPNVWFIAAAIFLTVLTVGFLFLASYLK